MQVYHSSSEIDTQQIGATIAKVIRKPACVHMIGDLGAGKTTLIRAIVAALGYTEAVTSPTYNLIHHYPIDGAPDDTLDGAQDNVSVHHMDLYRLNDPAELEFLALADIWSDDSIWLVEWPEKGAGWLPEATMRIEIVKQAESQREIRLIDCLS